MKEVFPEMPGILDEINLLFGKSDLYDVLNVANTSSSSESLFLVFICPRKVIVAVIVLICKLS